MGAANELGVTGRGGVDERGSGDAPDRTVPGRTVPGGSGPSGRGSSGRGGHRPGAAPTRWQALDAGTLATPLRVVVGWLFLSALWRRFVLAPEKMQLGVDGYVGEKFNHFLPQALGIGPLLEWLLQHPEVLHVAMIVFTVVEGIAGLALIVGVFTRWSALVVALLSVGILLSAGWLGTTCLDEWQIGSLGIAGGLVVMMTGGGRWSLDARLARRRPGLASWLGEGRWAALLSDGRVVLASTVVAAGLMLMTNQIFHNGIWGDLHNPSARPHVQVQQVEVLGDGHVRLRLFRDKGPDTYGAFVTQVTLLDAGDGVLSTLQTQALADAVVGDIDNELLVRTRTGPWGLVVPLGSRASVTLDFGAWPEGVRAVELQDVSGARWRGVI